MASDPPPAYSTLITSTTNPAATEEGASNCDDGTDLLINNSFEDKTTRIGFIQKVLAVKLLQLFLVAAVMGIFAANTRSVQWYMGRGLNHAHLTVISILAFVATLWLLVKVCNNQNRQQNPLRYLFLVVHPLSFTFVVSFLTIFWDFLAPVLEAWLTYCGAVFALLLYSVFAMQTKLEFAAKNGAILAVLVQIVCYATLVPIVYVDAFCVLYVTIILAVETVYVVLNLEIMTSKSYWTRIAPDDYLDGVLNLHIDYYFIVSKFLYPKILESSNTTDTS